MLRSPFCEADRDGEKGAAGIASVIARRYTVGQSTVLSLRRVLGTGCPTQLLPACDTSTRWIAGILPHSSNHCASLPFVGRLRWAALVRTPAIWRACT